MPDPANDPRLAEGIRLFNEREFFLCHDVLEDLWDDQVGPEKKFLQGLIQAAVALFHFTEGNLGGARKMYLSSRNYLTPYAPLCLNVDVRALLNAMDLCFQELAAASGKYPAHLSCNEAKMPLIEYAPQR